MRRSRAGIAQALYALLAQTPPHATVVGVKVQYGIAALPILLHILFFGGPKYQRGRLYGYLGVALRRVVHRRPMRKREVI